MSCVYFLENRDTNLIKVGKTVNLRPRINKVSRDVGASLSCIGAIPGGYLLERSIHKDFKSFRVVGEWFENNKYVVDSINDLVTERGLFGQKAIEEFSQSLIGSNPENEQSFVDFAAIIVHGNVDDYAKETASKSDAIAAYAVDAGISHSLAWSLVYRPPTQIGADAFFKILATNHDVDPALVAAAETLLEQIRAGKR